MCHILNSLYINTLYHITIVNESHHFLEEAKLKFFWTTTNTTLSLFEKKFSHRQTLQYMLFIHNYRDNNSTIAKKIIWLLLIICSKKGFLIVGMRQH
jgi:hypothetical protein